MAFRPATSEDEEWLWRLRLEQEKQPWYEGRSTMYPTHESWFARNRSRIGVWEQDGERAGYVRFESDGSIHFHCEDDETAVRMLEAAKVTAGKHGGRLKCTLDQADSRSAGLLEQAGWREYEARFFCYRP